MIVMLLKMIDSVCGIIVVGMSCIVVVVVIV